MCEQFEVSARGKSALFECGMQLPADAFFKIQSIERLAICLKVLKHFRAEVACYRRCAASWARDRNRALSNELKQSAVDLGVSRPIWEVDVLAPDIGKPQAGVPTCVIETPQDKLFNIRWLHVGWHQTIYTFS